LAGNNGYWEWPEQTTNDDVEQILQYILMSEKIRSTLSADTIAKLLAQRQKNVQEECKNAEIAYVTVYDERYWDM